MAKRKRLTPANPTFLGGPEPVETRPGLSPDIAATRSRAPIAEVAGEASASAALKELSEAMTRAREEGRLIQSLPLSDVDVAHLTRDRILADEDELQALIESLRARGQQTPIEVVDRGEGADPRYGLISGWRRMAALGRLAVADPAFDQVLAIVRAPKSAAEAYVAMVEENEIRVGLSYYERARIAVKAVEQGVYPDLTAALRGLFGNVSRAKRSKIKSFTQIVAALDGDLSFPASIGERLGLELARQLTEAPATVARIRSLLRAAELGRAEDEQAVLQMAMRPLPAQNAAPRPARPGGSSAPDRNGPGEIAVQMDAGAGRITLEGPGVDAALLRDLKMWLGDR